MPKDFNAERFCAIVSIVLHCLSKAGIPEISQLYLHKVLWYIDFVAYRDLGHSITGTQYQANTHGPTNKALNVSNFPISRSEGRVKYYSYDKSVKNNIDLSFNEKNIIAEICYIIAPHLKDKGGMKFLYDYIHRLETSYVESWEKSHGADIPYEMSSTIQFDKTYRAAVLSRG